MNVLFFVCMRCSICTISWNASWYAGGGGGGGGGTVYACWQEYMRTRVGNSIIWGLSRQNSKFIIDDARPLSFQVVMHSSLNTCMLARSKSSIFKTQWHFRLDLHFACTCSSKYSVQRWAQSSRINVFLFLAQTGVGSDDELRILP